MSIQDEAAEIELIAGLERALDNLFCRLRQNARAQWEQYFGGADASDGCVRVRISTAFETELSAISCVGFLNTPGGSETGKMRPRLA